MMHARGSSRAVTFFLLTVGVGGVSATAGAQPFTVQGPGVNPDDFRVTEFASGLNFPYGMLALSDGSLVVATSNPNPPGGDPFNSTGVLLRFVDANGDGIADGPGTVLYDELPGPLTALQRAGSLVLVTSSGPGTRITLLRMGPGPADPYTLIGSINFAFPPNWFHTTYALAVRQTPSFAPSFYDVFFNIGASGNTSHTFPPAAVSGLLSGSVIGASIYRVTVRDAPVPTVTRLTRIASGLRNAAGIAVHPATGDLYFEDNGINEPTNPDEPLSADELNRIPRSAIGGAVEDFGFPSTYIEYRTGTPVGTTGLPPLVAFQPIPTPNGSESEGPAMIAVAPPRLPSPVNDGFFVGFHGKSQVGLANEENPLVFWNRATDEYFHFVSNDEETIGHLDGLLATDDSLFLADFYSSVVSPPGSGVIYQIKAR